MKKELGVSFFTILFLTFSLASCSSRSLLGREMLTTKIAPDLGYKQTLVTGGLFDLTTFQKITDSSKHYVFYIEGDGEVWDKWTGISLDPTPRDLMMLRLAIRDPRPNVIYIARPCQFTPLNTQKNCYNIYWSDKRMSEEVIHSVNEVIRKIAGDAKVDLIGFSGGGGVAVLVAARNKQIRSIITICGNLDHIAFNKYHNKYRAARPMIGSLNPIDYALSINSVPQLHLSGGRDRRVPPFISQDYIIASNNSKCVKGLMNKKATHLQNWEKYFEQNKAIEPRCD